ncbi:MAG: endonuclease [Erysipelotrichaceae bacterium]|nr:endonuclease [Erysipelotrichaceae bacterium]
MKTKRALYIIPLIALLSSCVTNNSSSSSSDEQGTPDISSTIVSEDSSSISETTSIDEDSSTSENTSTSEEPSSSSSETSSSSSSSSSETPEPLTGYYDGISETATGTTLLGQLQSLNSAKRIRTIGYKNFGSYYKKTDGDLSKSGNLICFYSGTSESFSGSFSGSINREHVWPNSRGGGGIDGDIHMPRPTLTKENGSRGNSFYVEGKKSSSGGWDPAMESFGLEKYRGISARIIFYCVVASSSLSLVDLENDSTANKTMGKLSDLLKWNLEYGIDPTETQRNDAIAGSDIQGNRNPFIDHPEFACKIWGNYNTATKAVCGI